MTVNDMSRIAGISNAVRVSDPDEKKIQSSGINVRKRRSLPEEGK
jgi:hypothetical protein